MRLRFAVLLAIVCFVLLFGCLGPTPGVEDNKTAGSNKTNSSSIRIIINQQQNQTNVENQSGSQQNGTPSEPPKELEYEYKPNEKTGIYFISVGSAGTHGDAILIKKGDFDMLVDAGPASEGEKVVNFLRSYEVDDIEVLVSTNPDPRHYGGISTVADNFKVEQFWWGGDSFGDADYTRLIAKMTNATKTVKIVGDGYNAELDGMNVTVLNPPQVHKFGDVNNDAIVLRIVDRNLALLLTSGIQTGAQGRLTSEKKTEIQADVIQAPYYGVGAGTSTIGLFLITANPKTMIISGSSDESPQNGGSRDPYKRLMEEYHITWWENYANGTIRIINDGQSYSIDSLGVGQ